MRLERIASKVIGLLMFIPMAILFVPIQTPATENVSKTHVLPEEIAMAFATSFFYDRDFKKALTFISDKATYRNTTTKLKKEKIERQIAKTPPKEILRLKKIRFFYKNDLDNMREAIGGIFRKEGVSELEKVVSENIDKGLVCILKLNLEKTNFQGKDLQNQTLFFLYVIKKVDNSFKITHLDFSTISLKEIETESEADSLAKNTLKDLATAQEAFFVDNMRYSKSIKAITNQEHRIKIPDEVIVSIVYADSENYIINAYHNKGDKRFTILGPMSESKDQKILEEKK